MRLSYKHRTVMLVEGNLVHERNEEATTTRAIVCPHSSSFTPFWFEKTVQSSLMDAGVRLFPTLHDQAREDWLALGNSPTSHTNHLPGYTIHSRPLGFGKDILHVAVGNPHSRVPVSEETIYRAVKGVLNKAEDLGIERLSIPMIGSGSFGASYETSVHAILRACREHFEGSGGNGSFVKVVRVVGHQNMAEIVQAWSKHAGVFNQPQRS